MKTFDEVKQVVESLWDMGDAFWWRTSHDKSEVWCLCNCNDFFAWATADCERYEPEDIEPLKTAMAECEKLKEYSSFEWGPLLWIARKRKERPQGAFYKSIPEYLHPLFDACGEPRKKEFLNPVERA